MTDLSRSRAYNWRGAGLVGRALLHTPYHPITLYQRPQSFYPRSIHFAMQNPPPDQESLPEPDTNWEWLAEDRKEWKEGPEEFLGFYAYWRDREKASSDFINKFPYELSLGASSSAISPSNKPILVTKAYDEMYRHLLRLHKFDTGGNAKGAVITGQPGIGKTTFQWFVLTNLISAHQVVLFCNPIHMILFFCGRVYIRLMTSGFDNYLPKHSTERYCPIWALIDMNYNDQGPSITGQSNIWPIQMSSPSPIRWKSWQKRNKVALWGMPLWNEEELTRGFPLQHQYDEFRSELEKGLTGTPISIDTLNKEQIDAAVAVVLADRDRKTAMAAAAAWDHNQVGSGSRPMVNQQQPPQPVDVALGVLMRNAIEEFGYAPDDVFDGIFDLPGTKAKHADAVGTLEYPKLVTLCKTFSRDCELAEFSHRVVVVQPCEDLYNRDCWTINFKSLRIARTVVDSMRLLGHDCLRDMYRLLYRTSDTSDMARWIFIAIAHRVLSDKDTPQSTPMVSNGKVPPTFSTTGAPPPLTPSHDRVRVVKTVDLLCGLGDVTLDSDRYYIPASANNPLFDSFTITFDPDERTAVISVIRITTSPKHGEAADGYLLIRKIIARAHQLLEWASGHKTEIKVEYTLVCPDDGSQHQWAMPDGWDDNNTTNNQIGKAFCMRVPSRHLT